MKTFQEFIDNYDITEREYAYHDRNAKFDVEGKEIDTEENIDDDTESIEYKIYTKDGYLIKDDVKECDIWHELINLYEEYILKNTKEQRIDEFYITLFEWFIEHEYKEELSVLEYTNALRYLPEITAEMIKKYKYLEDTGIKITVTHDFKLFKELVNKYKEC